MVAAFVRAEIDSARFSRPYQDGLRSLRVRRRDLVSRPNLNNPVANEQRRFLLRGVRGYGINKFLFQGWPANVEWWRVRVALEELSTFQYAHYATWLTLSGGTRLVRDGANNVDTVPAPENTNANIKAVAALVRRGQRFPELILIAREREGPIVVMEGHTRATAYVITGLPDPVDCLLGISPHMDSWFYWGQP